MKAIILAAGKGERFGDITKTFGLKVHSVDSSDTEIERAWEKTITTGMYTMPRPSLKYSTTAQNRNVCD